ncbi:MAG: pntA [Rickettsiaceae bacterium]|jgi:NAD(P) transhydrogenase subunit alpha|nr:pntA [Rickettsiaceae bacterium]
MDQLPLIGKKANEIAKATNELASQISQLPLETACTNNAVDPAISLLTIFILASFVGYYVVWKVTPALHTPLMAVTNAISGIIIVGAMIALSPADFSVSGIFGFIACALASVNIFGGFVVTERMLGMFKKNK